jgi:ParB/RepB/Spo0J family partition protein
MAELLDYRISEIYSDADFNCRGKIAPIDVVDLAQSIDRIGLQVPIVIQPYKHPTDSAIKWRIISGHRRYAAVIVLGRKTIQAIVREGLSDTQARIFNLEENLKRKDLNLLQEAKALVPLMRYGLTQEDIADQTGTSRGWVQARVALLSLPDDIQQQAAAGFLNQEQIKSLKGMSREQQYEMVKKIKTAREKGERIKKLPKRKNPLERKQRVDTEIFDKIEDIEKVIGMGFWTRCMAWCAGTISDFELERDLKEFAEERGVKHEIPKEMLSAL